jgi:anti-anti-sigma factor
VQISARHSGKTTIFDLSGDIDFANSPEVRQLVLHEIRESRTRRVVVNLSQVRYIALYPASIDNPHSRKATE